MGTETRIGIATGLLIVAVAGIYFFYGSHRDEVDLLITADAKDVHPPRIPLSHEQKAQRSEGLPIRTASIDRRNQHRLNTAPITRSAHTTRRRHPKTARTPGHRHTEQIARTSPIFRPRSIPGNKGKPPIQNRARPSKREAPQLNKPAGQSQATLRGSPSTALVNATRKNLNTNLNGAIPQSTRQGVSPSRTQSTIKPTLRLHRGTPSQDAGIVWPQLHTIRAGETLSSLSRHYYSSRSMVQAILRANPKIKNPLTLKIGDVIILPAPPLSPARRITRTTDRKNDSSTRRSSALRDKAVDVPSRARTYVVKKGDTFYSISAKFFGTSKRWKAIYEANRVLVKGDPKRLKPGMTLQLPR